MRGRVGRAALLAGLFYAAHFGCWVSSLELTSVPSSVTLVTATPILLAAIAMVRGRDRPELRHWISIAVALFGLSIIAWTDVSGAGDAWLGDLLAIGGAVAMALYLLVVRGLGPDLDVLGFMGTACAVGAACLLGIAGAHAGIAGGPALEFASLESLGWICAAAVVPQLIGHTLLTWSLRDATPTAVGIATVGEPVGATALAWLWLGESVEPSTAIGCAIVLVAVLLSLRFT